MSIRLDSRLLVGAVALLTFVAFVLRLVLSGQALSGDELYTHDIATRAGVGDVLDGVRDTESTPPLFYVLAWLAAKLGDPTFTVRVPSLLASTATVPVAYLLATRLVGTRAGLLAAGAVALDPFLVFYGSEARAYALAGFLVVVFALALASRWWIVAGIAGAAAALTHYTALLPLAAMLVLALIAWPERRQIVAVGAATLAAACAWLPFNGEGPGPDLIGLFYPTTLENVLGAGARALAGFPPPVPLSELPGTVALIAVLMAAAAGWLLLLASGARPGIAITVVALSAPVGLLLYGIVKEDIFAPRNLLVAVPFAWLAIAAGVAPLRRAQAIALAGLAGAGLAAGVAIAVGDEDVRRPAYDEVAEYVEDRAGPRDVVIEIDPFGFPGPLRDTLEVNMPARPPVVPADSPAAERVTAAAPTVFLVQPARQISFRPVEPPEALRTRRLVEQRLFRGQADVAVRVYR